MTEKLRVLVADDHAPMREQVRLALEEDPRFAVCADVGDAPAAVEAALRERPDICLIDIGMPGSGIAATWEITSRLPETRVVILTVSNDEWDLFAALRAGASGYLLKGIDPRRLPHALYDVVRGEAAIPRSLVARILEEFRDSAPRRRALVADGPGEKLTSREWEVLDLMRRRLTTAEIAKRLVISPATVRSHAASVIRKLRVRDRAAAVRLFDEREPS